MIFLANQTQEKEGAACVVSSKGTSCTVEVPEKGAFTFDASKVDFKPDIAYLAYNPNRLEFYLTWSSEIAESRTGAAAAMLRNSALHHETKPEDNYIAAFWVGNTVAMHTMLTTYVESADCEVKDASYTSSVFNVFGDNIPEAKAFVKRARAKQRLLRHVNELSSLAMLEAQLDLLTEYVLSIHPNAELADAMETSSTLSVHTREKLIDTIKKQKAHLRSVQKEYFAERGDAVNSDPSV